jgi:endonuclease YncB( thermonuclease family)
MKRFKNPWLKTSLAVTAAGLLAAALSQHLVAATSAPAGATSASAPQAAPSSDSLATAPTYVVVACNDGDTCRLKASDNTQIKVRLVGIDAPEMGKKSKRKQKEGQSGGLEAKDFLNKLVVGKTVTLRSYGADAYGRNLAEIIVENEPANLRMVSEGLAEVYRGKPPKGFNLQPYLTAQEDAVKSKKGIWKNEQYESPKDFRKRTKD